jgi:PleD family two-component response regulator
VRLVSFLLYADDHEHMRLMVKDLLQASGHEVSTVPDGWSALAALEHREPDLLILDNSMPGLSGLEVCRTVKDNPFTARVPVLMLTAEADVSRKVAGFEAGADDYLAKPFDPRELRARVTALVRLVRREADRNPTSGFPGGRAIEDEIARRVSTGVPFSVAYFDIDNFKPFADTFGFTAADAVIRGTGLAIRDAIAAVGDPRAADGMRAFVGHIGGDDFIVVSSTERAEAIAEESRRRFRELIGQQVGRKVMERGTFAGVDRDGRLREFPIAGVSIAVLNVEPTQWLSMSHLGAAAADAKRRVKQGGGGIILAAAV